MTPPIDGTNHVQMLLYLLSMLQPLATGAGEKKSKASDCFNQALQDAPALAPERAFEHSVKLLPSLRAIQKTFEAVAPMKSPSLPRMDQKIPREPDDQNYFSQSQPTTQATQEERAIDLDANDSPSESPGEAEDSTAPKAKIPLPSVSNDDQDAPDLLQPSTLQLAKRLIEQIQTAVFDFDSTILPISDSEDAFSEKSDPMRQIAIRLQPAIAQLIDNLESFTRPSPQRQPVSSFMPRSSHVPSELLQKATGNEVFLNPTPRQSEAGERGGDGRFTPTGLSSIKEITPAALAAKTPSAGNPAAAQNIVSPDIKTAVNSTLRFRAGREAPTVSLGDGKAIPTAMPFASAPFAFSSFISAKRKKEKKKQSEDENSDEMGRLNDYSEKV